MEQHPTQRQLVHIERQSLALHAIDGNQRRFVPKNVYIARVERCVTTNKRVIAISLHRTIEAIAIICRVHDVGVGSFVVRKVVEHIYINLLLHNLVVTLPVANRHVGIYQAVVREAQHYIVGVSRLEVSRNRDSLTSRCGTCRERDIEYSVSRRCHHTLRHHTTISQAYRNPLARREVDIVRLVGQDQCLATLVCDAELSLLIGRKCQHARSWHLLNLHILECTPSY